MATMSVEPNASEPEKQEVGKPPSYFVEKSYLKLDSTLFGRVTVSLPLGGLIVCFIASTLFKFNEVNKTVCHVS